MTTTNNTFPHARRTQIVQYLQQNGHATVGQLAAVCGVSSDTIRRDLIVLDDRGLINRQRGGASAPGQLTGHVDPLHKRVESHRDAKVRLGQAAAAAISDGESIILGGGTTTLEVARAISQQRDLTLVTNNLLVPEAINPDSLREMWILGGKFNAQAFSTAGDLTLPGTSRLSTDRAIVSVSGISRHGYFAVAAPADGAMVRAFMASARLRVVVADSSKFGHDAFAHCMDFDEVDILITDAELPSVIAQKMVDAGVEIVIPDSPSEH